jgi:hypothetical protein
MTSIKLLHVLALEHHPQEVCWKKGIQVQHASVGIVRPHWGHINSGRCYVLPSINIREHILEEVHYPIVKIS